MRKVIDIKNLDFHYRRQSKLLSNLSLQLKTGSIYGLLGKNGEGKSTLLKLIAGLIFPLQGRVNVLGCEAGKRKTEMLEEIFFLPEEIQSSNLSIESFEMVYAPFYPNFSSSTYYKILQEFMIDTRIQHINELSFGQKKKFLIAFGVATNAKVILLDEPTNGLDIPSKKQFRRIISSAINEKCCIIISTHQVLDVEDLIDNIIIMDEHEIIFNETIKDITNILLFTTSETKEIDESIIYSEETTHGFNLIKENKAHEEGRLDIELLFNALMTDKNKIKEILNPTMN